MIEQEQRDGYDEPQLDEAVRQLAQRLAPKGGVAHANAKPARTSRPSVLLFSFLSALALLPSMALAVIALGSADTQHSLRAETRRAAAAISAFTAFLGAQESRRPKSQTKPVSVSLALADAIEGSPDEEMPLPISLGPTEAISNDVSIFIRGLPTATVFSEGRSAGAEGWVLRPDELSNLRMTLPSTSVGQYDLSVEVQERDGFIMAGRRLQLVVVDEPTETLASSRVEVDDDAASENELADSPQNKTERPMGNEMPALPDASEEQPVSILQGLADSEPAPPTDNTAADGMLASPLQDIVGDEMLASADSMFAAGEQPAFGEDIETVDEASLSAPQRGETTIRAANEELSSDSEEAPNSDVATEQVLVLRPEEVGRVQGLMTHGRKMVDVGYFAGARAYFKRAAEAGSGEAALALGATYDPHFIDEMGAHGIKPEPAEARAWYGRAKALGAEEAEAKLAALDQFERTARNISPQSNSQIGPASSPTSTKRDVGVKAQSQPPTMAITRPDDTLPSEVWAEPYGAVNMRKAPLPTGEAIRIVRKGNKLRVRDSKGSWLEVIDPETGKTGWIYSKAVEVTGPVGPQSP